MGRGLFTLPDTDSDLNPGTDIHLKNGRVTMADLDQNHSPCNVNMLCIVQCSHCVWNLNSGWYLNRCKAMEISHYNEYCLFQTPMSRSRGFNLLRLTHC